MTCKVNGWYDKYSKLCGVCFFFSFFLFMLNKTPACDIFTSLVSWVTCTNNNKQSQKLLYCLQGVFYCRSQLLSVYKSTLQSQSHLVNRKLYGKDERKNAITMEVGWETSKIGNKGKYYEGAHEGKNIVTA